MGSIHLSNRFYHSWQLTFHPICYLSARYLSHLSTDFLGPWFHRCLRCSQWIVQPPPVILIPAGQVQGSLDPTHRNPLLGFGWWYGSMVAW